MAWGNSPKALTGTYSLTFPPSPGELQRGVGLQALDRLRRRALEEQRDDLDQAADRHDQQDQHDHQEVAGLDLLVTDGRVIASHVDFLLLG